MAIKQHCAAIEYASDELKADIEVVLAAVNQDGETLKYASEVIRAD